MNPGMYSTGNGEYETPAWLFDALDQEFGFTLDPCCTKENAKCRKSYTIEEDGLAQSWGDDTVFMNPPYGRGVIEPWLEKAVDSAKRGAIVVGLLPFRCDTVWWHTWVMLAREIRMVEGRIKFVGEKDGAPFPSAVVLWTPPAIRSWTAKRG